MTKKTILVAVDKKGHVAIRAVGFTGDECVKATASLELSYGGATSRTPTDDMGRSVAAPQKQEKGQ